MEIIQKIFGVVFVLIGAGGMYIAGHTMAMHQHASQKEIDKMMLDANGNVNMVSYCKRAFMDCKKTLDDPLGINRELNRALFIFS